MPRIPASSLQRPPESNAWRSRIIGHADVPPAELVPNPRNWRTHPSEQQHALTGALAEVGWVTEVIVNQTTGRLVDGHLRVELALTRGEQTVPVTYVELTEAEEGLVLATLDPIGAMAAAERTTLDTLLASLDPADTDLRAFIEELGRQQETEIFRAGLADPDDVPDVPDEPWVKRGELYRLGDHRLLCGDATSLEDVARLVAGAVADIVWTDPPYGVAYQTKLSLEEAVARRRRTDGLEISNDALTPDATRALVTAALKVAPLRPGGAFYLSSPSGDMETVFRMALADAGLQLRQQLVWVKDVFVMGRQDYHWRHETVLYGWKDGAAHAFHGGRTQDTVWEIPRPRRSESHPTTKPVELVTRALANSSSPGELVYEPFAGSGTTIIAAEQTGRRCIALEIDPHYAQVAIERWASFTGQEPERIDA
jgi:DNA modification methylase